MEHDDEEEDERARKGVEDTNFKSILNKNKMTKNNDSPVLLSLEAFDRLEGVEDDTLDSDFTEHLTGDAVDISEGKIKVINALHGKKDVWARFGAGRMIQNILVNGLRLNFGGKLPFQYQEANNKSFINNKEFGVSQVLKLLENQVIEEVSPTDLQCVNPLSIASNRKGKQRLCLDLSRCVNEAVVAKTSARLSTTLGSTSSTGSTWDCVSRWRARTGTTDSWACPSAIVMQAES